MKQLVKVIVPATLLSLSFASHAQTSDGKTFAVSAGWAHIMPQGSKQGVMSESSNQNVSKTGFTSDAGFELEHSDTVEFKIDYLINDNVSLGLVLGVPPKLDIKGKGKLLNEKLNLDKFDKVGEVKVYSPVLTAKYHFGTADSKFRPYIGAGIMYAHFDNIKLDSALTNDPLLVATQGTIGNVKVDDAIAPVAFIGADYNMSSQWFATASVSYTHLNTNASLEVNGTHPQAGAFMVEGKTKIEVNPIVTYVGFGYRF